MKTCSKCVLDERFPGIQFNEAGVCNFCFSTKNIEEHSTTKNKSEAMFSRLILEHRGKGSYDCLLAYSGGKDSTYTLHLLRKKYGLKLLAYSFDNWFQSETARRNIMSVLNNVNVDHLTITPSFETMRKIILASMSKDMHSQKALTRASSICTSCISLIRFVGLRISIEQEIPFLVFGMSPGQAPLATAIVKVNAQMIRMTQNAFLKPVFKEMGDIIQSLLLEERHFKRPKKFPYSINPLSFTDYDEKEILRIVQGYGWRKPDDTDANSTNCLLNAFANQVHMEQFGFNPYAYEIAGMVRLGDMTRQDGLTKLEQPLPHDQIMEVKRKLGIGSS